MSTKLKKPYAAIAKEVSTNENDITDNTNPENNNINNMNYYYQNLEEDKNEEENELSEYNDENGAEMLNQGQYLEYNGNEEENEIYDNNENNEENHSDNGNIYVNENEENNEQNGIDNSNEENINNEDQNENNEITENSLSQQNIAMNSFSLEQMALLEKLKIKIMEKDKIIFQNRKKEQELTNTIEQLNSELNNQKLINENLSNKIQTLEKNQEKKEKENLSDEIEQTQKYIDLKNENVNLTNKVNELNSLIESKDKELENSKIIKQEINMEKKLEEKNEIPLLRKKIDELKQINNSFQEENTLLKEEQEKFIYEKEELMNKLSQKIKECSQDKIHENNIINLNNRFEHLFKEFQNILAENKSLIEKIKSTKNENDIFANIFTTELKNFLNFLESQNLSTKIGLKIPLSSLPNFFGTNLDKKYQLKFEVMVKCISQLKEEQEKR